MVILRLLKFLFMCGETGHGLEGDYTPASIRTAIRNSLKGRALQDISNFPLMQVERFCLIPSESNTSTRPPMTACLLFSMD